MSILFFIVIWIDFFLLLLTLIPFILYIFSLLYNLFFRNEKDLKKSKKKVIFTLNKLKEFKGEIKK